MTLVGSLLSLIEPFRIIRDQFKEYSESREVEKQLMSALQSLNLIQDSLKATEQHGEVLYKRIDSLPVPLKLRDAEDLVQIMTHFCNSFSDIISNVILFGKECNFLSSGGAEGFMEMVMKHKRVVHDFITTFGKAFNQEKESLNLTSLPYLLRLYGSKLDWKEKKESKILSDEIAAGKEKVSRVIDKAKAISKQRLPRVTDRRIVVQYQKSLGRFAQTTKKLTGDKDASKILTNGAPSWVIELNEIVNDVQKALPGLWKPTYRTPRVPGFRTNYPKTSHRR